MPIGKCFIGSAQTKLGAAAMQRIGLRLARQYRECVRCCLEFVIGKLEVEQLKAGK